MYRIKGSYVVGILMFLILAGCQNQVEHTAPAIRPQDSVAMMTSYGVNTLVSDSGVMKYRIVTERWEVNTSKNPSLWIFDKGLCWSSLMRNSILIVISSVIQLIIMISRRYGSFMVG